jgi:hypothetical protein
LQKEIWYGRGKGIDIEILRGEVMWSCILHERNLLESKLGYSVPISGDKANYEWLMESKAQLERGEVVVWK